MGRKLSFTGLAGSGGGGGGGGGSGGYAAKLDSKSWGCPAGWTFSSSYSSFGRQLGGLRGNQFYFNGYEANSSTQQTRHKFYMFDVNRTTGAISSVTESWSWTNNSGSGYSTCWYHHNLEGSGCGGGNICWPGYSSHMFGYDHWQCYSNNVTGTYSMTQDSHSDNGSYVALTGDGAGYSRMIMGGYYQGSSPWGPSNRTSYRVYNASGSTGNHGTMGGREWPANPHTSTSNPAAFFPQISNTTSVSAVDQGANGMVHANMMPYSTNQWMVVCVSGDGSKSDYLHGTTGTTQGQPCGIQMQDGTVFWRIRKDGGTFYNSTSYSSHTSVDVGPGFNNFNRSQYNFTWAGLGGDYWITGYHSQRAIQWGIPMGIAKITKGNSASGGGGEVKAAFQPSLEMYGAASDRYQAIFTLHSNSTDQYPDKLVCLSKTSGDMFVEVCALPDSADWAT